jgi:hypothetical protein
MTRYLLDTNMVGHFVDRRRGVDARVRGDPLSAHACQSWLNYSTASSSAPHAKSTGPDFYAASAEFGVGHSAASPPKSMGGSPLSLGESVVPCNRSTS